MSRILDVPRCPHCKTELAKPTPRMCPSCGGSLQKRHLAIGCLTSAPPLIAIVVGVAYVLRGLHREPRVEPTSSHVEAVPLDGG